MRFQDRNLRIDMSDLPRDAGSVKILLLHLDHMEASSLCEMLTERDDGEFDLVQVSQDAASAAGYLKSHRVDCVLADMGTAGLNDFADLREALGLSESTPILFLYDEASEYLARKTLQEGALDNILCKSEVSTGVLKDVIRHSVEWAGFETALANERDFLRALMDNLPDRIYFKDSESRFLRVNAAMAAFYGKQAEDFVGLSDFDFHPHEAAEARFRAEQRVIETGEPLVGLVEQDESAMESVIWVSTTKLPLRDRRNRIVGTFGLSRDITRIKEAESQLVDANANLTTAVNDVKRMHEQMNGLQFQLIEAEKAKSIARLAAGVAHEVKNPLAIISMGIEFLTMQVGTNVVASKVLQEISDAVQRADSVIKGLLDFSVPKQLTMEPCNVNEIIQAALVLVRGELKPWLHKVDLRLKEVPSVNLDQNKISQIFVNIFTNALHAMEQGGTLTVDTRTEQVTGVGSNIGGVASEVFQAGDRVVVIEVRDDGKGIPHENLVRIFDPFFTTKPTGKGTGLGMTVVKSIVDLHGGMIAVENRPEGGVMVKLTFKS